MRQLESAELWVGVISGADLRAESWMFVVQKEGYLDLRAIKDGKTTLHINNKTLPFVDNVYRLKIAFVGSQIDVYVNNNHLTPSGSLNFSRRRIFIGHQSVSTNISAYVSAQVADL